MVRLTREQSRAQTRERLLAAAATVFEQMGYSDASIDRIAEDAGYSKGAFYSNFASKEDIFLQLVEQLSSHNAEQLCAALDQENDPDKIISLVCDWANQRDQGPDFRPLILDLIRKVRSDAAMTERHSKLFHAQWESLGNRLLKIFPADQAPAPALVLGALVMELAYGNGSHFHIAPQAGDLIGLALRGLHQASINKA